MSEPAACSCRLPAHRWTARTCGRCVVATSASPTPLDTSAPVAFLVADHKHHDATFEALAQRELGLAGHVAFETFSVLTRLPPPARRTPAAVSRLLAANFPHSRFLSGQRTSELLCVARRQRTRRWGCL